CGPGWAVGIWFVPIANLWRPKQVIDDVWRASDPELAEDVGDDWKNERPSRLTGLWWAALILSGLVARVASGMSVRTLAGLQSRTSAFMFSDLLSVVAAIAAIVIVRRVTTRQEHRADLR